MLNAKGEILYVGKATSLKSRVNSYFRGQRNKDPRKLEMLTQTHNIAHIECGSALEAALLETDEIKKHDPPYNYSLKRKQRQLAFFDKSLQSMSHEQTDAFVIGPFSGHFALEQFTRVYTWLATSEEDPLIFFGEVPVELIASGFEIFCAEHNIDPAVVSSPRDLMALCIKLIRKSARQAEVAGESPLLDTGEPPEDMLEDEEDDDDTLVEYTPEDVAGKFGRLFKRIAKSYLRGKVLSRLLNSRIIFEEKSNIRRLEVRGGEIVRSDSAYEMPSSNKQPWSHLDVMTYDRMSVLLAEIIRMRSAGQNVIIEPDLPLFIVSHQIV
jgi:DNA polymerase-3 subunit epsilon